MVRAPQATANKSVIVLFWLLSLAGFVTLLGGVAAMQNSCGGSTINMLTQGGGTVGYLAPIPCSNFFQYTWWITFLHFFAWLLVLVYMVLNVVHKTRAALVGILAIASVLLMDTANTYLSFNYLPGLSGTMAARTRTTTAGAIIAAAADMLLILAIGWADDTTEAKERGESKTGAAYDTAPVPASPTTTTTTTAAPV